MRICGVDPGLQVTGYGVLEVGGDRFRIIDAGAIRSNSRLDLPARLHQIYTDLCQLLDETHPNVLAVENVYSHYNHPQTAVLMGHVRGVILLAAERCHLAVKQYAATQVKRALTGNGRASKAQMQQAIKLQLHLPTHPEPHDVADALAIAICGAMPQSSGVAQVSVSSSSNGEKAQ